MLDKRCRLAGLDRIGAVVAVSLREFIYMPIPRETLEISNFTISVQEHTNDSYGILAGDSLPAWPACSGAVRSFSPRSPLSGGGSFLSFSPGVRIEARACEKAKVLYKNRDNVAIQEPKSQFLQHHPVIWSLWWSCVGVEEEEVAH